MSILNTLLDTSNQTVVVSFLCLSVLRVYLEIISFKFSELPLTKVLSKSQGSQNMANFHKMGLILSVGYIVLFAPSLLLA